MKKIVISIAIILIGLVGLFLFSNSDKKIFQNGTLLALLDRLFYSASYDLT